MDPRPAAGARGLVLARGGAPLAPPCAALGPAVTSGDPIAARGACAAVVATLVVATLVVALVLTLGRWRLRPL